MQSRNHVTTQQQHSTTSTAIIPNGSNGAQLHKLLVSGASTNITSPVITSTIVNGGINGASELARLPGGAELNILPTGSNGTALYRGNGKLIVNNGLTIKGTKTFLEFLNHIKISNTFRRAKIKKKYYRFLYRRTHGS